MKMWATCVWTVRRLGPSQVTGGLEPLVDDRGLVEQPAGAIDPAEPSHGPARILGGQRELERA